MDRFLEQKKMANDFEYEAQHLKVGILEDWVLRKKVKNISGPKSLWNPALDNLNIFSFWV